MLRSILIVEDDPKLTENLSAVMSEAGWQVTTAANAEEAILALAAKSDPASVMLLDLWMPNIDDGFRVLEEARRRGLTMPSVFIVSGHLDEQAWAKIYTYSIQGVIPKPYKPHVLKDVLEAHWKNDESALSRISGIAPGRKTKLRVVEGADTRMYVYSRDESTSRVHPSESRTRLHRTTEKREDALKRYVRKSTEKNWSSDLCVEEPILLIARQWNSWYPSYFNVNGGAYAVITGIRKDGEGPLGAIIDPGFRSLAVLESLGASIAAFGSCLITHNHPDHVAGVFEYLALRHALEKTTQLFVTEPVRSMLQDYVSGGNTLQKFDSMPVDLIGEFRDKKGRRIKISASPFITCHANIGAERSTRGVILSCANYIDDEWQPLGDTVLLGDTEFSLRAASGNKAFVEIKEVLKRPLLRQVVLHIGSSQLKQKTGGHLYFAGVIDVLKYLDIYRESEVPNASQNKVLVLISEWGLEHARQDQIFKALPSKEYGEDVLAGFDMTSLQTETIEVIKSCWEFKTLTIIPADCGLAVGLETGAVYLKGVPTPPQEISVSSSIGGLAYGNGGGSTHRVP